MQVEKGFELAENALGSLQVKQLERAMSLYQERLEMNTMRTARNAISDEARHITTTSIRHVG